MSGSTGGPHLTLSGSGLTLEALVRAARDPAVRVACAPEAVKRVALHREQIEQISKRYADRWDTVKDRPDAKRELPMVYGVTTGLGEFKGIPIPPDQLKLLQKNILLSHSTGVGEDPNELNLANYFSADVVRGALLMRLNTFLKGHSGVRLETLTYLQAMLNGGIIPLVPLRGSVGSSGDLCPLAHLFATLLGEGLYYIVGNRADMAAATHEIKPAAERLEGDLREELQHGPGQMQWPFQPSYKEGLALTNGTAFAGAVLALGVHDAEQAATTADIAAALCFEAVCGRVRCLDANVHRVRPMAGQQSSAANLRAMLTGSNVVERAEDVQDVYSLRCAPQVHGATRDTIAYARMVIECEINAAIDNPLFFPGEQPWDLGFAAAHEEGDNRDREAYSAGNFHGQPLGLAADFLAIAVAELANISERRTQMLLDSDHNRNLPSNLIANRGINSGLMIAQYCAASLVSENKVLAHPASVDSVPTSANAEDHVSMATLAARKLRNVLNNTQAVLAIELLCAAQAIDWRVGMKRPAIKGKKPDYEDKTPAMVMKEAQAEAEAFRKATSPPQRAAIASQLGCGTGAAYLAVRNAVEPITEDCVLDDRLRRIWRLIRSGTVIAAVQDATDGALRPVKALRYAEQNQGV